MRHQERGPGQWASPVWRSCRKRYTEDCTVQKTWQIITKFVCHSARWTVGFWRITQSRSPAAFFHYSIDIMASSLHW
ncbi:hypothetical protein SCLCIDRAFT_700502 [Scleroderma citrinum Foug A]|uniref:Uncharacterized protein n=1 Tax=Scleroderma citrinum Foug A TaxID=1036808 RepID=A0A0C3E9H9_9AGAM|nr:hypothetical protein SCLCIDRAFT_700502 [Scleroderma citrinum Foug A]